MTISLAAIEAADKAATPGEWRVARNDEGVNWIDAGRYDEVVSPADVKCGSYCYGGSSRIDLSDADAELIALYRNAAPVLAQAIRVVLEIHSKRTYYAPNDTWICGDCYHAWPCPTRRVVTDAEVTE